MIQKEIVSQRNFSLKANAPLKILVLKLGVSFKMKKSTVRCSFLFWCVDQKGDSAPLVFSTVFDGARKTCAARDFATDKQMLIAASTNPERVFGEQRTCL